MPPRLTYPPTKFTFLRHGQAPGRLGFPTTGYETGQSGIRRPRESAAFPEGWAKGIMKQSPWWPPPAWFLDTVREQHSSKMEWLLFRAATLILGPEGNGWHFQYPVLGGRLRRGGAVIDVAVVQNNRYIAVRLQSERFHLARDLTTRMADRMQRIRLEQEGWTVCDIYEELISPTKETGAQAMYWFRQALLGIEAPSPAGTRTSRARR